MGMTIVYLVVYPKGSEPKLILAPRKVRVVVQCEPIRMTRVPFYNEETLPRVLPGRYIHLVGELMLELQCPLRSGDDGIAEGSVEIGALDVSRELEATLFRIDDRKGGIMRSADRVKLVNPNVANERKLFARFQESVQATGKVGGSLRLSVILTISISNGQGQFVDAYELPESGSV